MPNSAPYVSSNGPLAYLITFPTYGTWLHGDDRGSVDREHSIPGTPMLAPNERRVRYERRRLRHRPIILNDQARRIIRRTVHEVAERRGWTVHASNVRSNHVHIVVTADRPVERAMNDIKTWCSRRLIEAGIYPPGTRVWVRHGSTRYLWKTSELNDACRYVVEGQGVDLPDPEPRP